MHSRNSDTHNITFELSTHRRQAMMAALQSSMLTLPISASATYRPARPSLTTCPRRQTARPFGAVQSRRSGKPRHSSLQDEYQSTCDALAACNALRAACVNHRSIVLSYVRLVRCITNLDRVQVVQSARLLATNKRLDLKEFSVK